MLTVAKSTIVGKYETGPRTRISGRPWPGGEFTNFGIIFNYSFFTICSLIDGDKEFFLKMRLAQSPFICILDRFIYCIAAYGDKTGCLSDVLRPSGGGVKLLKI